MFKPMLSGTAPADLSKLSYPLLASPKLDGIRCIIRDGVAVSRSLKPIRNDYVRASLKGLPEGWDGELMVKGEFNDVQSAIMSREGEPDFSFCVFDWHVPRTDDNLTIEPSHFQGRLELLALWVDEVNRDFVELVPHRLVNSPDELTAFEAECLEAGFEGVMVRDPEGPYKYGRSTVREGWLLKIKQFEDTEAVIVGFKERMHNENEATTNELGLTERSSAKDGKRPAGDLGAFECVTDDGAEFDCGGGMTDAQRADFWVRKDELLGQTIKFKHLPPPGGRKDGQAPRHPVFLGFRHQDDL